jgi:hypothetical protein
MSRVSRARCGALTVLLLALCVVGTARADAALDALIAAYPDHLAGYDQTTLIWKDGTRMPLHHESEADRSFEAILKRPTIRDQFAIRYPLGTPARPPAVNEDPGRFRNDAFFIKMYGDCRRGEVSPRLKAVDWLPSRKGGRVMVTNVNGVADKLAAVSRELDALPAAMTAYLVPSAGTYNCRPVQDTGNLSVHAYGAAVDLATKFGDYWIWAGGKGKPAIPYRNRFPYEIVEIFERHGFIWGGRWYHYDTFHFEYRPELIALARKGWPK